MRTPAETVDTTAADDESLVDEILKTAMNRLVHAPPTVTTVQSSDGAAVAAARRLVAALNAHDRDESAAARVALAEADHYAPTISGPVPARLGWFHEYVRGELASVEGDALRAVAHLDRATRIAADNQLEREWLRSSANAMIALRSVARPADIIERLTRLFEERGRTSTDALFYQVVADTMGWLGRPRTALRVRTVGMDRRPTTDAWTYRNDREVARYLIAMGRLPEARASLETAKLLAPLVSAHEQLSAREVELSLLLAEGRPEEALGLAGDPDRMQALPRLAIHSAEAALSANELGRAATYLDAIDITRADIGVQVRWYAAQARRHELGGDIAAAATAERSALDLAVAAQPSAAAVNELVARVESWLDGEPAPSRAGRAEAMEGGLSDLRSALGTLMMLSELGDLDGLAHAEVSLAEVQVLIEAMSTDPAEAEDEPIDLHSLANEVFAEVEPVTRNRGLILVNAVPPSTAAHGPRDLLDVALQGICVMASTELVAGQRVIIEANAEPLDIAVVIPDVSEAQHEQFVRWFETTVARGHHVAASRRRLSVLGIPLARLWTGGLFTSLALVDGATQFHIASEMSRS